MQNYQFDEVESIDYKKEFFNNIPIITIQDNQEKQIEQKKYNNINAIEDHKIPIKAQNIMYYNQPFTHKWVIGVEIYNQNIKEMIIHSISCSFRNKNLLNRGRIVTNCNQNPITIQPSTYECACILLEIENIDNEDDLWIDFCCIINSESKNDYIQKENWINIGELCIPLLSQIVSSSMFDLSKYEYCKYF